MKNSDNFYTCLSISIALHLLAIYIFLFGIPNFSKKYMEDQENVITFEMLPISNVSNVQTQVKQNEKAIKNEEAKQVQKSKTEIKEEVKPVVEEKKLTEVTDKPNAEAIVKNEKKVEQVEPEKKIKEQPAKIVDKDIKKKEVKKKPLTSDLESLLKTLEQSSTGNNSKSNKHSRGEENSLNKESKGSYNNQLSLSISEQNLIKQYIQKHWSIPMAAQNIEEVAVTLHIELSKDGSVTSVIIAEKTCPNIPNSVCQALADSAQRAVWQASPIKNLIPENYNKWKEFNLIFYPRDVP